VREGAVQSWLGACTRDAGSIMLAETGRPGLVQSVLYTHESFWVAYVEKKKMLAEAASITPRYNICLVTPQWRYKYMRPIQLHCPTECSHT
jgi:hypothetical protein